jgi:hypothetical protein
MEVEMDAIAQKMAEVNFVYADKDPDAVAILEHRIAEAGKRLQLITYSDLVKGVDFHLPNVKKGAYRIQIYDWSGLDRDILGDFLGYISTRSYREHGFMASALVVNRSEYKPSDHFFEWMEKLEALESMDEDKVLEFWAKEVNKAHNWYAAGRK